MTPLDPVAVAKTAKIFRRALARKQAREASEADITDADVDAQDGETEHPEGGT